MLSLVTLVASVMAATPPSGSDISQQSSIVWTDPTWASGAHPTPRLNPGTLDVTMCQLCHLHACLPIECSTARLHPKQQHAALQVMETRATRVAPRMRTILPSRHFSCVSVVCGPRDALSPARL
jgi:hypothetical protein